MIDVHILHMPDENADWWSECEQSLKKQPIVVHSPPSIPGDILAARVAGYALGNEPYVSYADPDDRLTPHTYQMCLEALERDTTLGGVFTNSQVINPLGQMIQARVYPDKHQWSLDQHFTPGEEPIHQCAVIRRSTLTEALTYLPLLTLPDRQSYMDYVIYTLVALVSKWQFIPAIGYQWRRHEGGLHTANTPEHRQAVRQELATLRQQHFT